MTLLAAPPRTVRIALLGCGNIGTALSGELVRAGAPFELCAALVRDTARARGSAVPAELVRSTVADVLASKPDIAVECMGGVAAPARACEALLRSGVHVVSANKSMVAAALPALGAAAAAGGAQLRFDAAVCAGVPVLDSVARLRSARIASLHGIVNGTCNFVLHAMSRKGVSQGDALREAIALGYAEPDPTSDISGRDSAEKLCLLAAACGLGFPSVEQVTVQGLGGIDRTLVHDVRALGHDVRCVASLHADANGTVALSVHPTVVPYGSALANAEGTQNVVTVQTELAGTVTLSGPGAGASPTVAALMADIHACTQRAQAWASECAPTAAVTRDPGESAWLVRIAHDPAGGSHACTPDAVHAQLSRLGIQANGAAHLRDRTLLQVTATPAALRELADALNASQVSSLAVHPGVTLRF